ncbi:RNA-binding domain-containing protein [Paenibacillus sepulcri]|uniref:Transcriptional regulator n=1 Tax=Paenibacillus sepulcri TaxID=359917 RepID=A0ABS7BUY1_9BACL|nr:hypothetical protein [Paenibacillus sepulcri]
MVKVSITEILEAVGKGELLEHTSPNVELKREWKREVGEEVSALGNKLTHDVFWIVIGVEDNGLLSGKNEKWVKQTEQNISQHFNENLDPVQTSDGITCHQINGSYIVIIKISNPGSVVRWRHNSYKASGTTVLEMTPDEEMELIMKLPGLSDFSAQPWKGEINKEVALKFVECLILKRREFMYDQKEIDDPTKILDRLKIGNTNVSNILFGDFKFRVVFYDEQKEITRNETRSGLYSVLTEEFIAEIQEYSSKTEDENFSHRVLKEAIANAVAHAAYYENQGDLIIEVYKNSVCFSNLCLPESQFFANKWFSRSHKTINNLLMETLRTCGIVDELGRGKNLIYTYSLVTGKRPPEVLIEKAGRFNRWKINVYGGIQDPIQVRLLERLREKYKNEHKALIANALVLWRDKSVSEINKYIDGESAPLFAEVLHDPNGPIFYYSEEDRIVIRRWTRVLIEEGKDSMRLKMAEENDLKKLAFTISSKYRNYMITTKELRDLADMGNTRSEITLTSNLMKKWCSEGTVTRVSKGLYKFKKKQQTYELTFDQIMELLKGNSEASATIE